MTDHLTIAYLTSRKDCRIEWFFESLAQELDGDYRNVRLVFVDFQWKGRTLGNFPCPTVHVQPKPTVWQGQFRLTSQDYFAAANARNTALCLAPDGWIAYVDDLSVLMPGWLTCVRQAMHESYIVFGAYKKVLGLQMSNGVMSYRETPSGIDSRWGSGRDHPVPAAGSWLFGCSLAGPVEAFLQVNGWDEDADCCGMGGEDYLCGMALERAGYKFKYDRRMLTLESEELHHAEPPLIRLIEKVDGKPDASQVLLKMAIKGRCPAPNYFPPGGIRAERERVLRGGAFTPARCPEHSWYSGKPLKEL